MADFSIEGTTDPFLSVQLAQGESVFAEGGAMAAMEDTIDLTGQAKGGFLKSLARAATTGESFFMQQATAARGAGHILFSPGHPGEVRVVDVQGGAASAPPELFFAQADLQAAG